MRMEYEVTMADETVHKIVVDGRDYAKMEVYDLPPTAYYTRGRFLAWSAMTREKLTRAAFKQFNEDLCLDVVDITPPPPADEENEEIPAGDLDPTK